MNKDNNNNMHTRKLTLIPATVDDDTRSIMAVVATDNPVKVYRGGMMIDEVLDVNGVELPEKTALLDSHQSGSINQVLGSAREFAVVDGNQIHARIHFADTEDGRRAYRLYADGHATDFSVGYWVLSLDKDLLKDSSEKTIGDKTYKGRMHYVDEWQIGEVSAAVFGADRDAKARAAAVEPAPETVNNDDNHENRNTDDKDKENKLMDNEKDKDMDDVKTEKVVQAQAQRMEHAPDKDKGKDTSPAYAAVDIEAERKSALELYARQAEAAKTERQRIEEVISLCKQFDVDPSKHINSGASIDAVRTDILNQLAGSQSAQRILAQPMEDESEKYQRHISDGLMIRGGLPIDEGMRGQSNPFANMTMMEIGKDILRRNGIGYQNLNLMEIAGRVMTTSDFVNIINTTADKALMQGYREKPYLWGRFASTGSTNNFLAKTEVEVSRGGVLQELTTENPEFPMKIFTDGAQTYKIKRYGGMWAYSRVMLVNDGMDWIYNAQRMGATAARTVENEFFSYIESNPVMDDGERLFSVAHANIAAGGNIGAPSIATFNAAELAMASHKDRDGVTHLDIDPVFFLAPRALKGFTRTFLASPYWSDEAVAGIPDFATAGSRVNTWKEVLTEVYTSHLASQTAWYFLSEKGSHFKVIFLNGRQAPMLETSRRFETKDVLVTVALDFGVTVTDYRSVYYNAGA